MGGERAEDGEGEEPVFHELWFMAVMAAIALLLMAIILAVALHKALNKHHLTRERPPLAAMPMKTRNPMMAVYPASNSMLFDTVPDTVGVASSVTLKAFTMKMEEVLEAKCEATQDEGGVTSLRRSISQVMDGKSAPEDKAWDPAAVCGHDSGMFMDDEEFVDTIKGFSTIRKEHTMFTDTNL
uniref:usherin n=1 Tax=Doryrhamphus excisus TaxID=161450 RepID=UPI0025AEAFC1|nr:usherin [Doryrhamphus excisus]